MPLHLSRTLNLTTFNMTRQCTNCVYFRWKLNPWGNSYYPSCFYQGEVPSFVPAELCLNYKAKLAPTT